jgi:hypothetical protein
MEDYQLFLTTNLTSVSSNTFMKIHIPYNATSTATFQLLQTSGTDGQAAIFRQAGSLIANMNSVPPTGTEEFILPNVTPLRGQLIHARIAPSKDTFVAVDDPTQTGFLSLRIFGNLEPYTQTDTDGDGFADQLETYANTAPDNPAQTPDILGDINEDGIVNLLDALIMQRTVPQMPANYTPWRDIDQDTQLAQKDYTDLYHFAIGIHPMLPTIAP